MSKLRGHPNLCGKTGEQGEHDKDAAGPSWSNGLGNRGGLYKLFDESGSRIAVVQKFPRYTGRVRR